MSLIKSRLEQVFVRLNMAVPNDPALRNLSAMIDLTRKINDSMGRQGSVASASY